MKLWRRTVARKTSFTLEMDEFLRSYWEKYSVPEIAKMMGRAPETLRGRARYLGLKPRLKIIGLKRKPKTRKPVVSKEISEPGLPVKTEAWPDGWFIRPPTKAQLMAGR